MHDHCIAGGRGFRLDPLLDASRENQQTSLGARLLDRGAHERLDQFFEDDLARDGLRHFDHGREVEVFDRRRDRARRTGRRLFLSEMRIELIELPHLAVGSPTQVAVARLPQIDMRKIFETARRVETRGEFVGERLVVNKAVRARRADGLFIQAHRIERRGLRCGRSRRRPARRGSRNSPGNSRPRPRAAYDARRAPHMLLPLAGWMRRRSMRRARARCRSDIPPLRTCDRRRPSSRCAFEAASMAAA